MVPMSDLPPAMNFAALRQQGISLLEQMNGGVWTDFNLHDPGITILEAFCYVLTDLAYRDSYSIAGLAGQCRRRRFAGAFIRLPKILLPIRLR